MTANATHKDAGEDAKNQGQSAAARPAQDAKGAKAPGGREPAGEAPTPAAEDAPEKEDNAAEATGENSAPRSAAEDAASLLAVKLAHSEARLSATLAQYKEALDEFEGVKVRLKRDVGKEIDAGRRNILTALLEVLDNLERALEAATNTHGTKDGFFAGVSMVRDQFVQKLEAMGVVRREALGKMFDPDHFEAISTVPVADAAQDGRVVGVVRDCYMLGQETLRHGMVAVGKHG